MNNDEQYDEEDFDDDDDLGYEIGYGKPPKHSQFKPGESGNPLGRPKKRKNVSDIFQSQLDIKLSVNGKPMTKRELIIASLINDAIKGNASARRLALSMLQDEDVLEEFSPELDDRIAMIKLSRKLAQQQDESEDEPEES